MSTQLEIERKFLLKRLPSVEGLDKLEIEQYYCISGGEAFRIRKTVNFQTGETIYHKTIKIFVANGIYEENEEEIDSEEYLAYLKVYAIKWITKTRFVKKFGDLKWEIDVYPFKLVVAEIELPSMDYPLELPDYIEKELILEVTQNPQFTNKNLAEFCTPH